MQLWCWTLFDSFLRCNCSGYFYLPCLLKEYEAVCKTDYSDSAAVPGSCIVFIAWILRVVIQSTIYLELARDQQICSEKVRDREDNYL